MPYVPRPPDTIKCAHCKKLFERRHASRKYCSNSCNVLASYERTGYRGEPRATRADLERTVAQLMALVNIKPALVATSKPAAPKPAAKAQTKKPAAKAAVKQVPKPAKPAPLATKPAKKVAPKPTAAVARPKKAKKAAKQPVKPKEEATRIMRL
jgi:hypothetical protein